jgi:TonB family C-terminal domain
MAQGGRNHLSAVTSRRQNTSSARADKGILGIVVCIGVALLQSPSVRAQDAVQKVLPEPTILPELSKRTGPEPMKVQRTPIPDTEKPSLEVLAGTPSEKPVPIMRQTPPPKTEAIPVAAVEKKTPPAKRAIVQPKAPVPIPPIELTLSALKAVATSAPLPDYPYQAKRAHVTGSGICNLVVDSMNGRVTSATMAQSTGSQILDKVTTDTFGRWRFKPGTVAQVKVPITYE